MAGRRRKLRLKKIRKKGKKKSFNFRKEINRSFESDANKENVCMICGGETYDVHCKRICKNCGYMRDCSDP